MESGLIAARAVHLAATISLGGTFAFLCFVARLDAAPRLRRRLMAVAWSSLALALLSGAAWLLFVAARMSGQALGSALGQGVVAIVLARTLFGHIWILRFGLATIMACLLAAPVSRRGRWWRFSGLTLGAALLATLAWAGHGGATPGRPGDLHLAADIVHLLAAGAWVGVLLPLALLLTELRRSGTPEAAAAAHRAAVRFSILAAVGVALLMSAGAVNTWFLAGGAPALIGTAYGRLLLVKILLFLVMATVAAVNLLRMTPRLTLTDGAGRRAAAAAFGHLRRNALIEAGLAICVLLIVGILGILPPALHTEPGWPLPFRFQPGRLPVLSRAALALLATLAGALVAAAVATAAAGRYRAAIKSAGGFAFCLGLGWIVLRPTLEPAYPTSFYAPAEPYAAPSIARGARLFAENCVLCHGADGKGDGPAAAALSMRPADLTAPHLLSHTPGDLFWWVSQGTPNRAMPGFAPIMNGMQRWDVIDFIRARSAGALSRASGAEVSESSGPALPDFAFVSDGQQQTLIQTLQTGPALIALTAGEPVPARLAKLAGAGRAAAVPRVLAVDLDRGARPQTRIPPPFVEIAPEVAATLGLFRSPDDGGETDLLIDPAGDVRARWTASGSGGLPDAATLIADATRAAQSAAPPPATGHVH